MRLSFRATAVVLAASVAGCSTTATVHRSHGPAYEAEIAGSNSRSLAVRGEDGRTYVIPREEISGIDHPGNVTFTVGLAIMAFTALVIGSVAADQRNNNSDTEALVAVGVVYGLPGLLMAAYGGYSWLSSTGRARNLENAPPSPPLLAPPDQPYPPPPAPWNRPLVRKPSVTPGAAPAPGAPEESAPGEGAAPARPEPEVVVPPPAPPAPEDGNFER